MKDGNAAADVETANLKQKEKNELKEVSGVIDVTSQPNLTNLEITPCNITYEDTMNKESQ